MAKETWCTVTPMVGKENGTINISAPAFAGRAARSTVVTVQAVSGTRPSKTITVSQEGVGVVTTMDSTKPDVPREGATVVINGTSNSSKLKFNLLIVGLSEIQNGEQGVSYSVKVNDEAITNDTPIAGDPGAMAEYNFVATVVLPAAFWAFDSPMRFRLTDDTGVVKDCAFIWKGGFSTLNVNKSTVPLVGAGTAQSVEITSNDEWTVS